MKATLEKIKSAAMAELSGVDADLEQIISRLPSLDQELMLRAEATLMMEDADRAIDLLAAVENRQAPERDLLLGQALMQKGEYAAAADCLQRAENTYPADCLALLEVCFREQGDFKRAYEYACKRR